MSKEEKPTEFGRLLRESLDLLDPAASTHELVACTLLAFELTGRLVVRLSSHSRTSVALSALDATIRDSAAQGARQAASVVRATAIGIVPWLEKLEGPASRSEAQRLARDALSACGWGPVQTQ